MISIEKIDNDNLTSFCEFLNKVPSISKLDETILKNGIIAKENNDIIGSISFEEYDKAGLIRYFVFKKKLDNNVLDDMINNLIIVAKEHNLEKLVSIADNYPTINLFKSLGFEAIEGDVFIDEGEIENTNFKDSLVLIRNLI